MRRVVPAWEPHPPARELSRSLCHSIPDPGRGGAPPRRARTSGRGCRWTFTRLRADRVARALKGPTEGDRSSGWLGGLPRVERAAGLSGARRHSPRPGGKKNHTAAHVSLPPGSHKRSAPHRGKTIRIRPQIRRDNPLNLSILLSGGKETNKDSLSSGERRGKSPAPNPRPTGGRGKCGVRKTALPGADRGPKSF